LRNVLKNLTNYYIITGDFNANTQVGQTTTTTKKVQHLRIGFITI